MERKSLDGHQDTPWKTLEFSYTEEVAGSSPVPPTRLGAVYKGLDSPFSLCQVGILKRKKLRLRDRHFCP